MDSLNLRLLDAESRLTIIEERVNDPVERVKRDLLSKKVFNAKFITVCPNYYELSLAERASLMQCNIPQLCKSIIFENTMCDHSNFDDVSNSRFYCVVIQYISKINILLLRNLIHELRKPEDRISKKKFHFQLASEEDNVRLSGFEHNGIAPFGLHQKIPMVISSECMSVANPSILYLGGGKVDVKLAIPLQDLVRATGAIVGNITEPR